MKERLVYYRKLIVKFTLWLTLITIIGSCQGKQKDVEIEVMTKEKWDSIITLEDNPTIDLDSVKNNLKNEIPLFLSYWVGMNDLQIEAVTKYLISIQKIEVDDYDVFKKVQNFKMDQQSIYYNLYVEQQPLRLKIGFNLFEPSQTLESIQLNLPPKKGQKFSETDFLNLVNLYKKKYGRPISQTNMSGHKERTTLPDCYKVCSFQNDTIQVSLNFYDRKDEVDEDYGGSPLVILYENMKIVKSHAEDQAKYDEHQEKVRKMNKDYNERKTKETFDDM